MNFVVRLASSLLLVAVKRQDEQKSEYRSVIFWQCGELLLGIRFF